MPETTEAMQRIEERDEKTSCRTTLCGHVKHSAEPTRLVDIATCIAKKGDMHAGEAGDGKEGRGCSGMQ